jgi:hypothetical protein
VSCWGLAGCEFRGQQLRVVVRGVTTPPATARLCQLVLRADSISASYLQLSTDADVSLCVTLCDQALGEP